MSSVLVIGGGPAGIMAAITAAENGAQVDLWERNDRLGRKLAITGKGRCNITNNASTVQELVQNIPGHGNFLYGAFSRFSVEDTMNFFEYSGLPLKTERGRRVFPESDKASDVVDTLKSRLDACGVKVHFQRRCKKLAVKNGAVIGAYDMTGAFFPADAVVLATGGMSYPATGSTGDGYHLAEQAGHSIVEPMPSLVPLESVERWPADVSGLSLRNSKVSLYQGDKLLASEFGEMLFTHFGVSGPVILSLSRAFCSNRREDQPCRISIDLKPALDEEQLDERLQRDFQKFSRKQFQNSLNELLPSSLIPVFVSLSGIDAAKPCNQLSKGERKIIAQLLKDLSLTVKGTRPVSEAIVTAGGVSVSEIDPKSMASKITSGLFFAGELMDVDGFTGGYNLQAAWSSGYVAGLAAALL